ncbi:AAA family ATPase [Tistrella sp.]|nr:AAA family ATPase [Tistrella sp.]|tara:strand:+ start:39 stop:791 length:753 start_codon:yes stop_codon:yes gene_type:complete
MPEVIEEPKIDLHLSGTLAGSHAFAMTTVADDVMDAARWAQTGPDLSVVVGDPGIGKTEALRRYTLDAPNAWIATMSAEGEKPLAALEEICGVLGVTPAGSPSAVRRIIIRRVRDTGGCILIDEAQHLSTEALDTLRTIHDDAGIGLVLCGNARLWERVCLLSQLRSRVGRRVTLGKPGRQDVGVLASALGVEGRGEIDFLYTISQHPGGLRCVVKTVRLAVAYAGGDASLITKQHLGVAWANLSMGDVS